MSNNSNCRSSGWSHTWDVSSYKDLTESKPTPSKPTPTENLMEIIKAGKEQGLSELEIEMDKSAAVGITLGVFTDFGGVSINPEFEGKNRILIKIKYK